MTEMLSKEFSRRAFLKGGGALVVGFSIFGVGARRAVAAEDPYASMGPYDETQIDSWLTIHADNTVTAKLGVIELGQGTLTALLMIAAEELDVGLDQMRYVPHDTNVTPNQGETSGSNGIKRGGKQVRAAAAAARSALLELAASSLGVPRDGLTVSKGVVSGGGRSVTYGALLGDRLFNVRMPAAPSRGAGAPGTKPVDRYTLVGTRVPRVDIPAKISGQFVYVQNIKVPGMLHGRVVRPRGQGAYGGGTAPKILSVDASSIRGIPGAQVVRYRDFLGVVAPQEYRAIQAAAQLKVTWADPPPLPSSGNLWKQMRDHDSRGLAPAAVLSSPDTVHGLPISSGDTDAALASAATTLAHTYTFPYNGGVPIGPSCCVAHVTPSGARIFSQTQDAYGLRNLVKVVLDEVLGSQALPLNRIRVTYYEGASAFGARATTQDVGQGAAIMSALVGRPVRLQLMRWDEHGWNNFWPAYMFDMRAGMDRNGKLVAVEHTDFLIPYSATRASEQQVTGNAGVIPSPYVAATTASGLQYGIPNRKTITKTLPLLDNYFQGWWVRGPYRVQATFAAEQLFDELAHAAGIDPVAFRLQNIAGPATDPHQRWKTVLTRVAELARWEPKVAASRRSTAKVVHGRGVSFGFDHGTVVASIVDIEVNKATGKIVPSHVYSVVDPGFAVYPAGIENNLAGDIVQATSRVLLEQVAFDRRRVTSLDWVTYPILRFQDSPKLTLEVVSRSDIQDESGAGAHSGGGGEATASSIPAAIANAFFDATGVRMRHAPLSPARVRAALKAAGR